MKKSDIKLEAISDPLNTLPAIRNHNPEVIILDVMMPKMDGFTLAERVIDYNPEVPFIFLTARKLKEDKIKGLQLGADDYIVKPFSAD